MNTKTEKQIADIKSQTIGVEIEMNNITRANLEAELQAKDAAVAMYQQLLDGERREIELQKAIINKLEQQIKGDN